MHSQGMLSRISWTPASMTGFCGWTATPSLWTQEPFDGHCQFLSSLRGARGSSSCDLTGAAADMMMWIHDALCKLGQGSGALSVSRFLGGLLPGRTIDSVCLGFDRRAVTSAPDHVHSQQRSPNLPQLPRPQPSRTSSKALARKDRDVQRQPDSSYTAATAKRLSLPFSNGFVIRFQSGCKVGAQTRACLVCYKCLSPLSQLHLFGALAYCP